GTILNRGVPSSYEAPSVANTSATRPVMGARIVNALPDAAPPPLRSVSSRCSSRASAARSRASAVATARRASSARRAGTARSASRRSARVCSARALSSATCACAASDASVAWSSVPASRRRRTVDAEGPWSRWRRTAKHRRSAALFRCELDGGRSGVERLEVVELREVHGKARRLSGDERRILHVQLGLGGPVRDVQRRRLGLWRVAWPCARHRAGHRQEYRRLRTDRHRHYGISQ